jgi:ATP-dependent RNA helicase HelY
LGLLERWGFVAGWSLTEKGDRLRFVYNELDVAAVEAVTAGLFEGLTAAETAALASAFVYEPRVDSERSEWPTPRLKEAGDRLDAIDHRIAAAEQEAGLPVSRPPESGFAGLAHSWADGAELEELLDDDLAAGDFVRNCRQLIDLLRQLRDAFDEVADQANAALHRVDRGVVAAGGVE